MGGGTNTTTATSSTAPANPAVNSAITTLAQGINTEYAKGPKVNPVSLYGGVGDTTRQGWDTSLASAFNPSYKSGVEGAIDSYSKVARGDFLDGSDPAFQRDLTRTLDDTAADVNSFFGASGRLGGTSHVTDLSSSLAGVRDKAYMGERDRSRAYQAQAAGMLPSLYSAAQLPAATIGAVGAAKDADTQATLLGQNDLFRRTNDAGADWLAKFMSIANGAAQAGGTNTTNTQTSPATPWWQSALGLGLAFL